MKVILSSSAHRIEYAAKIIGDYTDANDIIKITSLDELKRLPERILSEAPFISFESSTIVPKEIIKAMECPGYNFHPAPPEYRGSDCHHFAIYDGARSYGATVHELTATIDDGPIVYAKHFEISPEETPLDILVRSRELLIGALKILAPDILKKRPLPHLKLNWGSRFTTRKMLHDMATIPLDIDRDEIERRIRAIGVRKRHIINLTIHGHKFRIDE